MALEQSQLIEALIFLLLRLDIQPHSRLVATHGRYSITPGLRELGKPVNQAVPSFDLPLGAKLDTGTIRGAVWASFGGQHFSPDFSGFYVVKIGPWHILHSGDNVAWKEPFLSSDEARGIDVAFMKLEAPAVVQRIHPRVLVPQHLLELNHGLDAYGHDALGVRHRKQGKNAPALLMLQWGDRYEIPKFK